MMDLTWQQNGACRTGDGTDFYPPMHTERKHERLARERRAKSVCAGCPVRHECLEHAIAVDERYGIWGGLNQDERRLLRASPDGSSTRRISAVTHASGSSRRQAGAGDAQVAAAAGDAAGVELGEQRHGVLAGDPGGLAELARP